MDPTNVYGQLSVAAVVTRIEGSGRTGPLLARNRWFGGNQGQTFLLEAFLKKGQLWTREKGQKKILTVVPKPISVRYRARHDACGDAYGGHDDGGGCGGDRDLSDHRFLSSIFVSLISRLILTSRERNYMLCSLFEC